MNNRILQALRIKQFSFLLAAEFFSQIAMNVFNFALLIVVFSVANSNTAVSIVVLMFTLPSIIFGIFAGVLVDTWNKRNVLLLTNILRALVIFPLAFFHSNLLLIYLATFLVSLVTQFFIPAETPIIPKLVDKELLLPANALFSMGIYASLFIAYALSGPILVVFGKSNIFLFLTSCFLIAAFFTYLIKKEVAKKELSERRGENTLPDIMSEAKTAFSLISKTKNIYHALFSLALAQIIILSLAVVGPGYAEHVLNIKVEDFPLFFVTPAVVGIAIGAVIIGNYFHKHSKPNLTKFGLLVSGVAILLLPFGDKVESRNFVQVINNFLPHFLTINILHIMVVLAFVLGFASAFVFIPANTILQEETSDEVRGKIYGVLNSLVGAVSLIPVLIVGGLADVIGVKAVITDVGLVIIMIALIRILITDRG